MMSLVASLALPLPAGLLSVALGLLCIAWGRRGPALLLCGGGLLGIATASSPAIVEPLAARLEATHPPVPLAAVERADAILVLGGGTQPAIPPREFPEVSHAGDRVLHAARLFRAGKAPWVLVSGGGGSADTPSEAESMASLLGELGVPDAAILRDTESTTTRENCRNGARILAAHGLDDALLVTSAIHMRRAHAACRAAALTVHAVPVDFWVSRGDADAAPSPWPEPETLALSHAIAHELLGYWVYERRGWLAP